MAHDPDLSSLFVTAAMDSFLSPKAFGESFESVRELTDTVRKAKAIRLPVEAGTRVMFAGGLGAYLGYDDAPAEGTLGTVISVKSATGNITAHDGRVFVEWDGGGARSIHADHLRLAPNTSAKTANSIRVSSLGDLTDFLKVANNALIHKSTRDLWSLKQDASGFVIERLFDDAGDPLKG
jgi:hypothetical protein